MTVICAWCQPATTDPDVSHGICEPCRRQMTAAYFGNSNQVRTPGPTTQQINLNSTLPQPCNPHTQGR